MTNVPLITFGATGFVSPSDSSILTGVQADINAAFGGGLNPALNTPQGQIASSETAVISNSNQAFVFITQMMDPAYSLGRWQDGIARIYFLTRNPALSTVLQCACVGAAGTVILINSLIQDDAGFIYYNQQTVTIPISGTVNAVFVNQQTGPIAVPETDEVSIYQAIPGWDSVTVSSGTIGQAVESRAAFEQRREDSVSGNAFGPVGAMIGAVAKVPGVLDYFGYSNNTASSITELPNGVPLGFTLPANSIYIAVAGGTQAAVSTAILSKLSPGPPMTGNITVTAFDTNPLYEAPVPYTIKYQTPDGLNILFAINIVNGPNVPSNYQALIQQAIINASAGNFTGCPRARIASLVLAANYVAPVLALGSWVQIRSIRVGSNNDADAVSFTASISGNTLTVSGGTPPSIGMVISGANNDIPPGVTVLSGTGPFTISATLGTIGSEAMIGVDIDGNSTQVAANQIPEVVASNIFATAT